MDPETISGKRQSERVSIALRIQVFGTDAIGQEFAEEAQTVLVSRHGATIVLNSQLVPEQEVTVRCLATSLETPARVVGKVGTSPEGHLYGVEILDREINLWGIQFPPLAGSAEAAGRVLLECMACRVREVAHLTDLELEVFQHSQRLSRKCTHCNQTTLWGECQHEAPSRREQLGARPVLTATPSPPPASKQTGERRRAPRLKVKTGACVRVPGRGEEHLVSEDVSRGGFRFRSSRRYTTGSLIEVAVPYTPEGVNIFIPARIAWVEEQPTTGIWTYGVAYIQMGRQSPKP